MLRADLKTANIARMKTKPLIHRADWLAAALLLAVLAVLFHRTPGGFWRYDDPDILLHAMQSPGLTAFFDPEDWRHLSGVHLTPWVTFSYKLDLWLFGFSPAFFYMHQLLSLAVTVLALYALARHALSWPWALAVGVLFLAGIPTATVVERLMTRHYVEGFAFALMATMAFLAAERKRHLGWAIAGAVLYALATTAKEIYVPLPLVLLCLPMSTSAEAGAALASCDWRTRLRCLAPYMLVALLYAGWRYYMLGTLLGSFLIPGGQALEAAGKADVAALVAGKMRVALRSFAHIPVLLFGKWWAWPTGVFFGALLFALWRRPRWVPLALAALLALLGPLLPLAMNSAIYEPGRYVFLLWGVFSLFAVLLIRQFGAQIGQRALPGRFACLLLGGVLYAALLVPAAGQQAAIGRLQQVQHKMLDVQGRFFMEKEGQACLMPLPEPDYIMIDRFCGIRHLRGEACPQVFLQDVPLERPCGQWFAFDSERATLTEVAGPADITQADMRRPLRVEIAADDGMFRWALGPYAEGRYYLVASTFGRVPPPGAAGALRISVKRLDLRVQYESPEGWKTISPLLTVSRGKPLIWERKALPNEP
ncbi:MAG: hypothetical protein Q4A28_09290 [Brachymonas sp.]|nr:hypothetical protein [Brachymonas sp.]